MTLALKHFELHVVSDPSDLARYMYAGLHGENSVSLDYPFAIVLTDSDEVRFVKLSDVSVVVDGWDETA